MADEQVPDQVELQPAIQPPEDDRSLESALDNAFNQETPNEEKQTPEPEVKPTKSEAKPSPVDKGGQSKPAAKAKEPLPDPETIAETPTKGPDGKTRGAWDGLRNSYKAAHKTIQEREGEIERLKKEIAEKVTGSTAEMEKLKKDISELSKYRAMVDVQADPEFISKYDQPYEKSLKSIKDTLKRFLPGPEMDEHINKFDYTNLKEVDSIINAIQEKHGKLEAKKFERKIEELVDIKMNREEALLNQKENYQKTLEERKKEAFSKGVETEGRMMKHYEGLSKMEAEDKTPAFPFLVKKDAPEGANAGQIQQIEAHNELVDQMDKRVKEVMKMEQPEQKAEIAVAAVRSLYLEAQLKGLMAKNKALEDEIKKISVATDETPKTSLRKSSNTNGNGREMDLDAALASHFGR